MKTQIILLLIAAGLAIYSCKKTDETCKDVNDGSLTFTQKSLESVPYWGKSVVVFRDSLNNEIQFTVQQDDDVMLQWSLPGTCTTNSKDTIYHNFQAALKKVNLTNDSINFSLAANVTTLLDWEHFKKYDLLFIDNSVADTGTLQNLNIVVDNRDVPAQQAQQMNDDEIQFDSSIEIFGETYQDVYELKYFDRYSSYKMYYSYELGVVSFKDNAGKRWVFKNMQ